MSRRRNRNSGDSGGTSRSPLRRIIRWIVKIKLIIILIIIIITALIVWRIANWLNNRSGDSQFVEAMYTNAAFLETVPDYLL